MSSIEEVNNWYFWARIIIWTGVIFLYIPEIKKLYGKIKPNSTRNDKSKNM
jgi:hypothetical protein